MIRREGKGWSGGQKRLGKRINEKIEVECGNGWEREERRRHERERKDGEMRKANKNGSVGGGKIQGKKKLRKSDI